MAAAGNFLLLAAFGAPALRALRRFRQRFDYYYLPTPHPASARALKGRGRISEMASAWPATPHVLRAGRGGEGFAHRRGHAMMHRRPG